LRQRWPLAFPEDLRQLKPWALGIHHALVAELPDTKPALIGKTLNFLQRGGKGAYWHALLKGGPRYNLDGTPNGEVTEKDQEHAREQLAAIRAWRKVKQQARPEPSSSPGADAKESPCLLRTGIQPAEIRPHLSRFLLHLSLGQSSCVERKPGRQ
jgi:sRNA-binding protein